MAVSGSINADLSRKVKSYAAEYGLYYLLGLIFIIGLKYYYSKASIDDLDWILSPTAWWVTVLSGIPFEKELHIGFINHDHRFIIAASCSGINFLIIAFSTLFFSFIHRMKAGKMKALWLVAVLVSSYSLTILINGLRIILSIYILGLDIYGGWITPERVHMIEGTTVYFLSVLIIYLLAGELVKRFDCQGNEYPGKLSMTLIYKCIPPVFWYLSITLGVPLLTRAYMNNGMQFMEYVILMVGICVICIAVTIFTAILQRCIISQKK